MEYNLGWNHTCDFKINRAHSASSIWNHKYDFRPKLHGTRFNYHFITSILKNKSFGNKGCKICHMILFVFHFPAIRLVTLYKPWSLIGCFVFSVASSLAGKMMRFKARNGAPIRANQITRTTSDFKMDVIKFLIPLIALSHIIFRQTDMSFFFLSQKYDTFHLCSDLTVTKENGKPYLDDLVVFYSKRKSCAHGSSKFAV